MAKRILVVTQHYWPENFRINANGLKAIITVGLNLKFTKGYKFLGAKKLNAKTIQICVYF